MTTRQRPGDEPAYTPRTPRVVAARKLHARRARDDRRLFLAEGPQAVREALAVEAAEELYVTDPAAERHRDLLARARDTGVRVSRVTAEALEALAETTHPQGLVAVCRHRDIPLAQALAAGPGLIAVLADIRDPGNAGTVLRTADAAGAQVVVFAGDAVDPYNGKCVRASAGSLFHLDVVRERDPVAVVEALRAAGLQVLAAYLRDAESLDDLADGGALVEPTAWLFGSEAHGLPQALAALADRRVRVPIYGQAESLNLAAAAAVCLYASAQARRR